MEKKDRLCISGLITGTSIAVVLNSQQSCSVGNQRFWSFGIVMNKDAIRSDYVLTFKVF